MKKQLAASFEDLSSEEQDRLLQAIHARWQPAREPNYRQTSLGMLAELNGEWCINGEAFKGALKAAGFSLHSGSDPACFVYCKKQNGRSRR